MLCWPLQKEAGAARSALEQDRATLASTVRSAVEKEEGLEDHCNRLATDNEQLTLQVSSSHGGGMVCGATGVVP